MRNVVGCILLFLPCLTVWPQGQVVLNNRVFNAVVSPAYAPEPTDPQLVKHGNTAGGTPPGVQVYSGDLLAGSGFTAQLFGGPTNTLDEDLRPLLPTTTFQTGALAGFIVPPLNAISVGDVPPAANARLQLRCWDNVGGTISNWLQVVTDPTIARGSSLAFTSPPLGGLFLPPPNPIGLESFNLATGEVATARIRINFQTNSVAVPPGYLPDYGEVFGDRGNGFTYGWNADRSLYTRAQYSSNSPDPRYDSFILMDSPVGAFWEINLTRGVYQVHIAVGDPLSLTGVYRVEVENTLTVDGTPIAGNNWIEGNAAVSVTDGRLSIRSADGSSSNRLCFVDITYVGHPKPEMLPPTPGDLSSNQLHLTLLGDPSVEHLIEVSTDLLDWTALGAATPITSNRLDFFAPYDPDVPQRFYRARTIP